jgi:hypothetical protein
MSDPTPTESGITNAGNQPVAEHVSPGVRNLAGINPNIPAPPSEGDTSSATRSAFDNNGSSSAGGNQSSSSLTPLPELPAAPPSRVVGAGYNATSHTIPTVSGYKKEREQWDQQADEYARIVEQRARETDERRAKAEERARQQAAGSGDGPGDMNKMETTGEKLEETNSKKDGNVLKSAKNMKDEINPNKPANEKQRMMDQMNAHNRRSGSQEACTAQADARFRSIMMSVLTRYSQADRQAQQG